MFKSRCSILAISWTPCNAEEQQHKRILWKRIPRLFTINKIILYGIKFVFWFEAYVGITT
jgi:hypothetical protein